MQGCPFLPSAGEEPGQGQDCGEEHVGDSVREGSTGRKASEWCCSELVGWILQITVLLMLSLEVLRTVPSPKVSNYPCVGNKPGPI